MPSVVNQYFDKVYVLSLRSNVQRRSRMKSLLDSLEIDFEFFDAEDGGSIIFDREWELYSSRPLATPQERKKNRKLITSRGAWGCLRSYISLLRHVLLARHNKVLIFEDDIIVSKDFESDFETFMRSVSNDWKLLFLGASHGNWTDEKFFDKYYHPTPDWTYGAFALGYSRDVLPLILKEALQMMSPYDKQPLSVVMKKYPNQCYVAYPNVIIADVRDSNIREKRDFEVHAEKMKWDLSKFNLS